MEPRYIIILDFTIGELIKIKLSDNEIKESEKYEDFSEYLTTIEDKYGFILKNSLYMTTNSLSERNYLS